VNTISYLLACGYPALVAILIIVHSNRVVRVREETIATVRDACKVEHERAFMEGTRLLAEQLGAVQLEVERAREVAQAERDKTSRYFDQIRVFEQQRDEWQRLYFEQSAGHGGAQALMMGTIENLARELHARGGRPQIPKVLHAVRSEYEQTHELPAREGLAALNAAIKAAAPVPEVAISPEVTVTVAS